MKLKKESIDHFFDYDISLETRTLVLHDHLEGDGVGPRMSDRFMKGFHLLSAADSKAEITILMNSYGGYTTDGMAIFDQIKASSCPVKIVAAGACMSAASIIMQAASNRVAYVSTVFLLHDGTAATDQTPMRSFEAWAEFYKNDRERMYRIYASKSKKGASFWRKHCANDLILSAEQALNLGLIDSIQGQDANIIR